MYITLWNDNNENYYCYIFVKI